MVDQADENSAVYASQVGDEDRLWNPDRQLMASMVDMLTWQVWSKSKDGQKNRNRPKPIPRPGVTEHEKKTIGGKKSATSAANVAALLGM
jgi:hypothetical protein